MRGLNTSGGRQVKLIATTAFAAAIELRLDIIQSSESQSNYEKKLIEPRIPDPKTVREMQLPMLQKNHKLH